MDSDAVESAATSGVPPVNSVPGTQTVNEDTVLVFSSATSNAISVSDVDAGSNSVKVTLTATNGILKLSGTSGLTVTGDNSATVNLTGTLSDFQKALAKLDHEMEHAATGDLHAHAKHSRDSILPAMASVRSAGDTLEGIVADDLWPLPSYREMLFVK